MKDCETGRLLLSTTDVLSRVDDRNRAIKHQLKSQCESRVLLAAFKAILSTGNQKAG